MLVFPKFGIFLFNEIEFLVSGTFLMPPKTNFGYLITASHGGERKNSFFFLSPPC